MTTSDYRKVLKQIKNKPAKMAKYSKYNIPKERSCGVARKKCRRCGRNSAHIDMYGLDLCRNCFREIAPKLGFKKYS